MVMKDTIRRLKSKDDEERRRDHEDGKIAGRGWVELSATPKRLRRLEQLIADREGIEQKFSGHTANFWGFLFNLIASMRRAFCCISCVDEFWARQIGDDAERLYDEDFGSGFAEGALEMWKEVNDRAKRMDHVLARLKAAGDLEAKEDYEAGFQAGKEWAKNYAKPKELMRLAEYIADDEGITWWDVDDPFWDAPFAAMDVFVFAVWPHRKGHGNAPREFWSRVLDDDMARIQDADFFHGFGDGAADVWRKKVRKKN